jgi:DNA-directed RNA polymerase specialized sigma24 family protein
MNAVQFDFGLPSDANFYPKPRPYDRYLRSMRDAALIALASHGDRSAVGVLYERHHDTLYVAACAALREHDASAHDVVHDVFALLLAGRTGPFVAARGCALAWLRGIVRRTADAYKKGGSP